MAITKGQLEDQIGMSGPRPSLYCAECGETYSANAGDYFIWPDNYIFECCDELMVLVIKRTVFEQVAA
jgi:hypothetical protein